MYLEVSTVNLLILNTYFYVHKMFELIRALRVFHANSKNDKDLLDYTEYGCYIRLW